MVDECVRKEISVYKRIKDKKKILRINFDDFAKNTNFNINKICHFLNLKKTLFTKKIMKKENLPRILHKFERTEKLKKIKSKVSEKKFKKLLNLEIFYNNN
jgi:DNA-binding transcriptional MerR regulator